MLIIFISLSSYVSLLWNFTRMKSQELRILHYHPAFKKWREEELKLLFVFHSLFTTSVCSHIRKIKTIIYLPQCSSGTSLRPPRIFVYRRFFVIYGLSGVNLVFVTHISLMNLQVFRRNSRKNKMMQVTGEFVARLSLFPTKDRRQSKCDGKADLCSLYCLCLHTKCIHI